MSTLMEFLRGFPRRVVSAADLEQRFIDYPAGVEAIETLVREGILEPVKRSGTNGRRPPLAARYRIRPDPATSGSELKHALLTLPAPMNPLRFYSSHPGEFERDRPLIEALAAWLRRPATANPVSIPANERSFEIFRDEKALLGRGAGVLKRLGLTLDHLACFPTSEPFVTFPFAEPVRTVLVCENRDAFFSCHRSAREGHRHLDGTPVDAVVYGEGRKIIRSLPYAVEIFRATPGTVAVLYWGDLDPEGIRILLDLQTGHPEWSVQAALPLYRGMVAACPHPPRCSRSQRTLDIAPFFTTLPADLATPVRDLLDQGYYIPQEALAFPRLREVLRSV